METKIKILILEHDPNDIGLLQYELRKSGLNHITEIVQTKEDYESALGCIKPDIVLSDYSLPAFDGLSAFRMKQDVSPETPFIIVSGTLGEEKAVELIKMGVTDYALKDKIYQIIPKVQRALTEAAERKKKEAAELQLRQREEQLQKIMDLSLDVICTVDQDGRFITINAASKLVLDYLPEELVGRRVVDMVHEEDKNRTLEAIANLQHGIDIINLEIQFIRKSGALITLLWSARWDSKDKLGYGVVKDITGIKKAEEKIRNNEKRFRALLQNSVDGLTLVAADGTIIERSATALKILELDASEISEKLRLDLVHPDDVSAFNEAYMQVTDNLNDILTIEYRLLMPVGNYKWIEATLHNQLQEPAVRAIVLNFRDITERKLAEIALEKSEEKYRNLFDLSPTPMWAYDVENLRFLNINEAAIRHYGYSKNEFLSMTIKDILPKEDVESFEELLISFKGSINAHYHDVKRHVKKNGEVIDVDIQCNSLDLLGREVRVVLATDVSERIKYIQAIEEQNDKLREIAWTQSHVVRAPLARIMGIASLLNTCSPEIVSTTELLKSIQTSAHEMDIIIRDIVNKTDQIKYQPILEEQPER